MGKTRSMLIHGWDKTYNGRNRHTCKEVRRNARTSEKQEWVQEVTKEEVRR